MICKGCNREIPEKRDIDPQHPLFEKKNHEPGCLEYKHMVEFCSRKVPDNWARGPYRNKQGLLIGGRLK